MMKRQRRAGGVHTGYIMDMLEVAKAGLYYSDLYMGTKIRFKKTFLRMLAWMVNEKLLNHKKIRWRVRYTTTQKGRDLVDMLSTYEDA